MHQYLDLLCLQFHSQLKNKNKKRETGIEVWNSEIESLFTLAV